MSHRIRLTLITLLVALASVAVPTQASAQGSNSFDPADTRLVPNPIDNSDPGTVWTCRVTGKEVQCAGTSSVVWQQQEGPDDWCSAPLYTINGTFSRTQTRYYFYDEATGSYLEYKRLVHIRSTEYFTPSSEPATSNVVMAGLNMTWQTVFQVPGDLNSRITRKQGIDTLMKRPDGGVLLLDVGQKTNDKYIAADDDFDFRGRWDIALGDSPAPFGKLCSALGL